MDLTQILRLSLRTALTSVSAMAASAAAHSQTCPAHNVPVQPNDSRYTAGIACGTVGSGLGSDHTILLEEGIRIAGDGRPGVEILVGGAGNVAVEASGSTSFLAGGLGQHGIHIRDGTGGGKKVKLDVKDVTSTADGIRVTGIRGEIDLRSTGAINVSGEIPAKEDSAGALHVRLVDSNLTNPQKTQISVNNISSTATNPSGILAAGILVDSPGTVAVNSTGKISTTGEDLHAIAVMLAPDKSSDTGSVSITANDISTIGNRSYAIWVHRQFDNGKDNRFPINLTLNGDVRTGGWESHGIAIQGNKAEIDVTIKQGGSIFVGPAKAGWESDSEYSDSETEPVAKAIYIKEHDSDLGIASVSLKNYGTVTGEIFAEGCVAPEFANFGTFNPGAKVELLLYSGRNARGCGTIGANSDLDAGRLTNSGTLSPGGSGSIANTAITADLVQPETGILEIDVDWSKTESDFIALDGAATLAGSLKINHLALFSSEQLAELNDGERSEVKVMNATGGITGLPAVSFSDSLLLKHGVRTDNSKKELFVWASPAKNIDGLNQNQRNILAEVTDAKESNPTIRSVYGSLLEISELKSLQFELDGLGNEIAGASMQSGIRSLYEFSRTAPSCLDDLDTAPSLTLCTEISGAAANHSRLRIFEERDHSSQINRLMTTVGWNLYGADAGLELSLGIEQGRTVISRLASSDGSSVLASLRFTGKAGYVDYQLASAVNIGTHKISRTVPFNNAVTGGAMHTATHAVDAEAAYPVSAGQMRFSPFVGLSAAYFTSGPYNETGAGDLSLEVSGAKGETFEGRAGIDIEMAEIDTMGIAIMPHLGLSWHHAVSREIETDSKLAGGLAPVRSTTSLLPSRLNAQFGAKFKSPSGNLTGHAGIALVEGAGGRSTQSQANAGLTYTF